MKRKSHRRTQQNAFHGVTPDLAAKRLSPNDIFMLAMQALVLVVAVAIVYVNSLSCPFTFDDVGGIWGNKCIRTLWPLCNVLWNAPLDSPAAGRPVVSLSFAINYALGGLNVESYHLFNMVVHMTAVLMLWSVLRRTLMNTPLNVRFGKSAPFLAFAIALIWAVHPLQTESVTYISQRTELLMGLFYLLTLYCAILAWQSNHRRSWSVAAVVSCAIGMGCKETMVSAPLIVLLYDVTLLSSSWRDALRKHWKLYIGLAATWGLLAWFNLSGPRSQTCGWDVGMSPLDYLRTQAEIIVWYLRLCFWPHPLVISYQGWPLAKNFIAILPQGLLIIALLSLTVWALWHRYPVALLGAWFFMILGPTSSFIPIVTEIAAERRMYLPSAAVIVATVVGIYVLARWVNRRLAKPSRGSVAIAAIALALVTISLGITTFMRNRDYRSAMSIWTDTVTKRPDNPDAWSNLGSALGNMGEHKQAIDAYTKAIELTDDQAKIYECRGTAHAAMGDFDKAIQDFNRAIELQPNFATAYHKRGSACGLTGDYHKAIADYTRAIDLQPDYGMTYYNRGTAYNAIRNYVSAVQDFNRAIELKKDYKEAYYNRAISYYGLKEYGKAWVDVERCQKLGGQVNPEFIKALTRVSSRPE